MYSIYKFVEKSTDKVIYVGSTARFSARMKEHGLAIIGSKPQSKIHKYLAENNLQLYKDIEVIICDSATTKELAHELESNLFYLYQETLLNDRPAEIKFGEFNPKRRQIHCLESGRTFKTVLAASRYYNIPRTTIYKYLDIKPYIKNGKHLTFVSV